NLIPKGKVVSYGQVALMAGIPRGAQAVGQILCRHGEKTPWWRIINNAGRISTKCLDHTGLMQKHLLQKEDIKVTKNMKINIEKYRWRPNLKTLKKLELKEEYVEKIIEKYLL
ncbi:MGMT family protein, partial [Patescibacteria group bacterium]